MKTLLIVVNTAIICYCVHLYMSFDSMQAAINRVVFEVVTGLI